ncbi:hypothetical protein EsVE80_12030 [Enterococcus saigonensis]|uniref:Inosine-5-monophosphate dehydrogenase n=1 Tax=Enterococcus saigonensis TaxID=1805431 RepID=A0A679IBJ7_9ENTE|nr:DUF1002 domain-containing protein [Enterococcus saigonensis]BCA85680.1 hypothetical protein EsVE80_12030 [Enterococcus saigonensis]
MIVKTNNKLRNLLLIVAILFTTIIGFAKSAAAAEETVINERWGKPTVVLGSALNNTQRAETLDKFGVNPDDVTIEVANGADLVKYLGYGSGDDNVMFSSVMVTRENEGKGVKVNILTPENITLITADQYKNPLITAGIADATITVASVVKVTGESALTGVYKAFEANGEKVSEKRAQLAQEELDTTQSVSDSIIKNAAQKNNDENLSKTDQEKADEAYRTQLNQTLVEIKQELASLKEKQGELATKADVEKIVGDALAKYNLTDFITQDDVNKLVSLAQKYQQTEGVLDKDSLAQLDKLGESFNKTVDKLTDELGSFGEKLKGTLNDNQGFFTNLWQSIKDFFSNIFN